MKEPFDEGKQTFLDKFYNWYLKDLQLDQATKATNFLIDHIGKAHEISWNNSFDYDEGVKKTTPILIITATYHLRVDKTIIKTHYHCTIYLPNET